MNGKCQLSHLKNVFLFPKFIFSILSIIISFPLTMSKPFKKSELMTYQKELTYWSIVSIVLNNKLCYTLFMSFLWFVQNMPSITNVKWCNKALKVDYVQLEFLVSNFQRKQKYHQKCCHIIHFFIKPILYFCRKNGLLMQIYEQW